MKVADWLNRWLDMCSAGLKWSTVLRYGESIKCYIVPVLGELELEELSPDVLQEFVRSLEDENLAYNTIASIVSVMKRSVQQAVCEGVTRVNNTGTMHLPEHTEREVECFTVWEQKAICDAVLHKCSEGKTEYREYGILISMYTGLRLGELLALTWDDVNLHAGTIRISKTCWYAKDRDGKYARIVTKPKTRKSARTIPIPDDLLPYLRDMYTHRDCSYVISHRGKPVPTRSYQSFFTRFLDKLGIRHRGFHALRHTFATRALECEIDARTTSEILGHSSTGITLQRYTHVLMEHMRHEMNRMGVFLRGHSPGDPYLSADSQSAVCVQYGCEYRT